MATTARMLTTKGAALAIAGALALPAVAAADQTITAAPQNRYQNPQVTIAQGERLTFRNTDIAKHDVTAAGTFDNKPLFSTPIIGNGQEAFVEGSQYLTTGTYDFYCSVHPFMTGTVTVTAAGTPVPRPGGTSALKAKITSSDIDKVAKTRKLNVRLTVGEHTMASLKAAVGHTTLGTADAEAHPGDTKVTIRISKAAAKKLRKLKSAKVKVTITAQGSAGTTTQTVSGRLR